MSSLLSKSCYIPVSVEDWNEAEMLRAYRKLCILVSIIEDNSSLSSSLANSTWGPKAEIPSKLVLTCKSLKHLVQFRNVHAAPSSWWAGLSVWLARTLEEELNGMQHVLRDSTQLAEQLWDEVLEPGERFMRIDIKEFFMSGDAETLVLSGCSIISNPAKREVAERVARFFAQSSIGEK